MYFYIAINSSKKFALIRNALCSTPNRGCSVSMLRVSPLFYPNYRCQTNEHPSFICTRLITVALAGWRLNALLFSQQSESFVRSGINKQTKPRIKVKLFPFRLDRRGIPVDRKRYIQKQYKTSSLHWNRTLKELWSQAKLLALFLRKED
jgi:hypothetical protein